MKKLIIEFNWISSEPFYIIPTVSINNELKCHSVLFFKWALDFNY